MSRAPNLSASDIETVVGVLDGWTGKLTWERLIAVLEATLRATYTRQALSNHARIADAFDQRKKGLRGADCAKKPAPRDTSPEMQAALQRLERVEAENARLTAENERLLVQFVLWLLQRGDAGPNQRATLRSDAGGTSGTHCARQARWKDRSMTTISASGATVGGAERRGLQGLADEQVRP
jgi:hypothetical protein